MAGSWDHMTTKSGKLLNNENFANMIENPGDAYEAAEECYGMVWFLANWMLDMVGHDGPPYSRDELAKIVETARKNYKEGLAIGGVQRD